MKKIKIPFVLQKLNSIFEENGYEAFLVGGAVRDVLMGKEPSDYDVATNAEPEQVKKIFRKVIPTGIAHGTVTVHFMQKEIEVTTFRTESDYSDGRHPDNVAFTRNLDEDLSRRDFTMNAIAASLKDGKIIDLFGGQEDIKNRTIRTVGNPYERFLEDGLRPIRAIRFSAKLNFKIEAETLKAISAPEILEKTKSVSLERFRDELLKLMQAKKPSDGLKIMEKTGILHIFMPEFDDCRGCVQRDFRGFHEFDVLDHLFYACDGAPKQKINVRMAALLHDIGKPAAKKVVQTPEGETNTFYRHEQISAKIAEKMLFRLKFSNAEIGNICHLIENHMFNYEPTWKDSAVRRFLVKVKAENVDDLFDLRIADIYGMHNQPVRLQDSPVAALLIEFKERIDSEEQKKSALSLKSLAVNGKNLMEIGIPGGKMLGEILNELFETVLDDPSQNTKETLLNIAKKIYENRNL